MNNTNLIKKYYDSRSACQVLGCLMQDTNLVKSNYNVLETQDFLGGVHQTIFTCLFNLAQQGVKRITVGEIESYLATADPVGHKRIFDNQNNVDWIHKTLADANLSNYDYHYQTVRKFALLRDCISNGTDISHILNMNEIDPKLIKIQRDDFNNKTVRDIIKTIDVNHLNIKKRFLVKEKNSSRKAGDDAEELFEEMQKSPSYGLGFESEYLNTIMYGANKSEFLLETRDSGKGKSRVGIKRLLNFTAPHIWDFQNHCFTDNPNNPNGDVSALYIGTEMDLYKDIEPMMWCFIAGVEPYKLKKNMLTNDERERIKKAMKILKDTPLFLEDESNFDISYLWQTVEEYKIKHNIYAASLDYIELTPALISEYVASTRGMNAREDMVLLNLSKEGKKIAKDLDVFFNAFTQTTDEARRDHIRDQRAVKGARSLPNKVDYGIVTFAPIQKELEKLQPVINSQKGILNHPKEPNICYSFYKGRSSEYSDVKVWGYQNLGTYEYYDLFCTNQEYKKININPTKIQVVDKNIITT